MFQFTPTGDKGLEIEIQAKRFDATNTDKFKASFEEYCVQKFDFININVKNVEFIDSSGIGTLLSLQNYLSDPKGQITLIDPQPAVTSVVELLRLRSIFELIKSQAGRD